MEVFISYSPNDAAMLEELVAEMQLVLPQVDFQYDQADDRGSQEWWNRVKRGIANADTFLLMLSADWLNSKANRAEYSLARKLEKDLLTVKVDSAVRVPSALRQGQVLDLSSGVQASDDTDALFAALGVVPGAMIDEPAVEPMTAEDTVINTNTPITSAPIPFDDLNRSSDPGAAQVPDDILAPGVPIDPQPTESTDTPVIVAEPVPANEPESSRTLLSNLPIFPIITLVSFTAVLVGIVMIGLNVVEWGLIVLLGGVVGGAILSLIVFIQQRT